MIANVTGALPTNVPLRRFTADELSRMAAHGILGEDEPVELLDGDVELPTLDVLWPIADIVG